MENDGAREISDEAVRALRLLTQAQRAIQRAASEPEMLRGVCEVVTDIGGFQLAWFGQINDDKTVTPVAAAGEAREYVDDIEVTWDTSPTGRGPVGTAVRERRPVVTGETDNDPTFAPWSEAAAAHGLASSVALPVLTQDEIHGTLNIYSDTHRHFGDDEIDLLTELADALCLGLLAVRERERRKHAEQRLRAKTVELQTALSTAEEALEHVKQLQGILPICMHCHKIRDDQAAWQRIEEYITNHSAATFTHSLCPDCLAEHYPQLADEASSQEL